MPRSTAYILVFLLASVANAQFPLGPGNHPPQPIVDPAINEFICKTVVRHAMLASPPAELLNVELVSARWQGELVFVFSRVSWSTKHFWHSTHTEHVAEVQYSMVQRRFRRLVYELWCQKTVPAVYSFYDLGRVRTRINEELYRFDQIAGDNIFPGPWPRGPSTYVPQITTTPTSGPTPASKGVEQRVREVVEPDPTVPLLVPPVVPPVVVPPVVDPPAPPPNQQSPTPMPPSSTGAEKKTPPVVPMPR